MQDCQPSNHEPDEFSFMALLSHGCWLGRNVIRCHDPFTLQTDSVRAIN
jgi:hypothetical protein